jgi:hypothetical protein
MTATIHVGEIPITVTIKVSECSPSVQPPDGTSPWCSSFTRLDVARAYAISKLNLSGAATQSVKVRHEKHPACCIDRESH